MANSAVRLRCICRDEKSRERRQAAVSNVCASPHAASPVPRKISSTFSRAHRFDCELELRAAAPFQFKIRNFIAARARARVSSLHCSKSDTFISRRAITRGWNLWAAAHYGAAFAKWPGIFHAELEAAINCSCISSAALFSCRLFHASYAELAPLSVFR